MLKEINIVQMTKQDQWIRFEITQGSNLAHMTNSRGEYFVESKESAQMRIATLARIGWYAITVG